MSSSSPTRHRDCPPSRNARIATGCAEGARLRAGARRRGRHRRVAALRWRCRSRRQRLDEVDRKLLRDFHRQFAAARLCKQHSAAINERKSDRDIKKRFLFRRFSRSHAARPRRHVAWYAFSGSPDLEDFACVNAAPATAEKRARLPCAHRQSCDLFSHEVRPTRSRETGRTSDEWIRQRTASRAPHRRTWCRHYDLATEAAKTASSAPG